MKTHREEIFEKINKERDYQGKWAEFDEKWGEGDWLLILEGLVDAAKKDRWSLPNAQKPEVYQRHLLKIAATAVAAIENTDL